LKKINHSFKKVEKLLIVATYHEYNYDYNANFSYNYKKYKDITTAQLIFKEDLLETWGDKKIENIKFSVIPLVGEKDFMYYVKISKFSIIHEYELADFSKFFDKNIICQFRNFEYVGGGKVQSSCEKANQGGDLGSIDMKIIECGRCDYSYCNLFNKNMNDENQE
jgi:hypothetical protein